LHPWVHPHPTQTDSGVGTGFIFHLRVHPNLEKSHNFSPAVQPSHFALNLSCSHTYISHESSFQPQTQSPEPISRTQERRRNDLTPRAKGPVARPTPLLSSVGMAVSAWALQLLCCSRPVSCSLLPDGSGPVLPCVQQYSYPADVHAFSSRPIQHTKL
jgi:hypothetical protein